MIIFTKQALQQLQWKSWEGTPKELSLEASSEPRKTDVGGADVTCWGRLFQVWAAKTGKAWSSTMDSCVWWTVGDIVDWCEGIWLWNLHCV